MENSPQVKSEGKSQGRAHASKKLASSKIFICPSREKKLGRTPAEMDFGFKTRGVSRYE